jgi:hypothetical protein
MFNSFYQPIATMKFGVEVDYGHRKALTGNDSDALRYYFTTQYDF